MSDHGLIIAVTITVTRATMLPVTRDKDNKKMAKTTANCMTTAKINKPIAMTISFKMLNKNCEKYVNERTDYNYFLFCHSLFYKYVE